ncbi:glycoside hydrolase family 28 protein [Mucilaginibacter terrae]|uniref:rhamnogalacturonidase n=1 Tax=Mucilaginibacter terrae TaxID=1955052 RepID=UPI0036281951
MNLKLPFKTCLFIYILLRGFLPAKATPATSVYNVKDYGAKGDGKQMDAPGINKAIEAAAANGGGTVLLPAGIYLSGSIHLKSNINLLIDQGATLVAAAYGSGAVYDEPEATENDKYQDFGHSHWHNSLIWGENLENVSITGTGIIYGKGLARNSRKTDKAPNKAISLKLCKNVLIRDITIFHGGWFGILATGVDNLTIDNIKEDTNRDGMDIDCCHYVNIANCKINTPLDDGICLKSSFALNMLRATENVTITNCIVSGYDEGTVLDGTYKRTPPSDKFDLGPFGRIKFGTESNGGFKNIAISNCVFDYCRGLAIESTDGALIEDVTVTNITMRDIVNSPIYVRIGSRMRAPEGTAIGQIKRILISNVVVYNADPRQSSIISGVPGGYIDDISLHDIRIYTKGGGTREQSKREMPEVEKAYPEPERHGVTPAYGFYIRHAKNIDMHDIKLRATIDDMRPVFFIDEVSGVNLHHINTVRTLKQPVYILKDVKDFNLSQSTGTADIKVANTTYKELN